MQATPTQIDAAVERIWPSLSPQLFIRDLLDHGSAWLPRPEMTSPQAT